MNEKIISAAVAISGIVLAAIGVWLAARIINRRKRVGARDWIVLGVALLLYPLSFGPACWISSHSCRGAGIVSVAYQPLFSIWWTGPRGVRDTVEWYGSLWAKEGWDVGMPPDDGNGLRWDDFSGSTHVSLAAAYYYANANADADEPKPDSGSPPYETRSSSVTPDPAATGK